MRDQSVGALRLKTDRVLLEMHAKMDPQSDLNWSRSFQKRSLKTTFAQGPQKGPIPTPLNLENRAPVGAPALFSLSQPCPKSCPKGSPKRSQGTLKSTKNSNKTVFNKSLKLIPISYHVFGPPRSQNRPQGTPKGTKNSPKGTQSAVENIRQPTRRKVSPRTFPKTHLGMFWGACRCLFC